MFLLGIVGVRRHLGPLRRGPRRDGADRRARPAGRAGALLTPAALAVIATTFSGEARGAAIGSWTAWTGIAFVIGPLAGGWLVDECRLALRSS